MYRSHTASSPPRRTVRSTVPASPISERIHHRTQPATACLSQSSAPTGTPASHMRCSHRFRINGGYTDTAITPDPLRRTRANVNAGVGASSDARPARRQSRASGASRASASTGQRSRGQPCGEPSPENGPRLRRRALAFGPISTALMLPSARSLSMFRRVVSRDRVGDAGVVRRRPRRTSAMPRSAYPIASASGR